MISTAAIRYTIAGHSEIDLYPSLDRAAANLRHYADGARAFELAAPVCHHVRVAAACTICN